MTDGSSSTPVGDGIGCGEVGCGLVGCGLVGCGMVRYGRVGID